MWPPIEPFASGLLTVRDGSRIYWEASGNPDGVPMVWLHGGPGSGLPSTGYRRQLDPEQWLIVGLDQRACGRSRPLATEPGFDLSTLTTQTMIADLEDLRVHLGIERWLVAGGSWGATLAQAYAQAHRDRVTAVGGGRGHHHQPGRGRVDHRRRWAGSSRGSGTPTRRPPVGGRASASSTPTWSG